VSCAHKPVPVAMPLGRCQALNLVSQLFSLIKLFSPFNWPTTSRMSRSINVIRSAFIDLTLPSPGPLAEKMLVEVEKQVRYEAYLESQLKNTIPTPTVINNRTKWTPEELVDISDHAARYEGVPNWRYAVEGRSESQCRRVWS
jgi:hypothetical protein